MRAHALIALALVAGVFAVYAPVPNHDFVDYDDPVYAEKLRAGVSTEGLRRAVAEPVVANWIPATMLSLLVGQAVHGPEAGGHLLVNAALHAATAIALYATLMAATGAMLPSAFVAGVFAVHPLHVESVAWVSQRKDVLCGFFWILTLAAHRRYADRPGPLRYAAVFLGTLLALLSKPMAVTLPFTLLLFDYWPLGRLRQSGRRLPGARPLARAVTEKLPLFALAALASVITFQVQSSSGAVASADALPLGLRAANALTSIVAYLGDAIWPGGLAVFYPHPKALPPTPWLIVAALGLVGISAAALHQARARPHWLVGWLWFLGTLVPVLGLVQVGEQARADRYTYIPLIGLALAVAFTTSELGARWRRSRPAWIAVATLALLALTISARAQVLHWRDSTALYARALAVTDDNAFAHRGLGRALRRAGRLEEAEGHLAAAMQLEPGRAANRRELAEIRAQQGDIEGAIAHYGALLRTDPDDVRALVNQGQLLVQARRLDEAHDVLGDALARSQHGAPLPAAFRRILHLNLARTFAMRNELELAREHAAQAIALDSGSPGPRVVMADLALRAGDRATARTQLDLAIALAESDGDAGLADALRARRDRLAAPGAPD
jgi:tetratricopeptide (TPR) repeat protein